jgi:hypothetical protein
MEHSTENEAIIGNLSDKVEYMAAMMRDMIGPMMNGTLQ